MKILFLLLIPLVAFSQNESIEKMKKLPKAEFERAFNDSIQNLESLELWNFIKNAKESEIDLKDFNSTFLKRFETVESAIEMIFLLEILIDQKTEKSIIENTLNNKKEIWDKGTWAEKFWKIIRENDFKIIESNHYTINKKGEKKYNVKLFIEEKIMQNEMGENPLLEVDYVITNYSENTLLETLEKLTIKDIQIIPKQKSVGLFGKRGVDGMIKVLTS
ncbi:hypothetical protein [Flavobacterium sp.]|jgi:hypothetical protein|uniref:hypothetical protein n=1 Tax=Flavobacterium sp. TaxID=239 RepID=UPI0037BF22A0